MFVGRDTKGIHQDSITSEESSYNEDELTWLAKDGGYRYSKSPFWRVIGKSMSNILGEDYDYDIFKKVVWSNIYKICQYDRKAITSKTRKLQTELCAELLIEEIKDIKPKAIVFLTGDMLEPFLTKWGNSIEIKYEHHIRYMKAFNMKIGGVTIPAIVLDHPQSRNAREEKHIHYISLYMKSEDKSEFINAANSENQYYTAHNRVKSKLEKSGGSWFIYLDNDLGLNAFEINGCKIGIESSYESEGDEMFAYYNYRFTVWNAKSKRFLLNEFKEKANAYFADELPGGSLDIKNTVSRRANLHFPSLDLRELSGSENEEKRDALIIGKLRALKIFLKEYK